MSSGSIDKLESNINNSRLHIVEDDISIKGKWENQFDNADWCFHFAAPVDILESIDNPVKYFEKLKNFT